MAVPLYTVTNYPLNLDKLIEAVDSEGSATTTAGAVVSFLGVVRNVNLGKQVVRLEYEAYEPLAVKVFERIATEARARWPEVKLAVHHRLGTLHIGESSVAIVAASPHRDEAFAACRYAIERVKQIAPIWKREFFDGGDVWIEEATVNPDDGAAREDAFKRACK